MKWRKPSGQRKIHSSTNTNRMHMLRALRELEASGEQFMKLVDLKTPHQKLEQHQRFQRHPSA